MTINNVYSWLGLCPINFTAFSKINDHIGDAEATLLYSKLLFQAKGSKFKDDLGRIRITRTRETLSQWINSKTAKADRALKTIKDSGLIHIAKGMWYGKRQLFITLLQDSDVIPINLKIMEYLITKTGSVKGALLLGLIAFRLNKTKIQKNDAPWCCITKEEICTYLKISARTADRVVGSLTAKGLIFAENRVWAKKRRLHFTIPLTVYEKLSRELLEISCSQEEKGLETARPCKEALKAIKETEIPDNAIPLKEASFDFGVSPLQGHAKIEAPIRVSSNSFKVDNITNKKMFEKIDAQLSPFQTYFLLAALDKTVKKAGLTLTNKTEVFEEVKFSILNPQQRRGVTSFTHAVSRCMKLLRERVWRTPIGFYKHSDYGATLRQQREEDLNNHLLRKQDEIEAAKKAKIEKNTDSFTQKAISFAIKLSSFCNKLDGASAPEGVSLEEVNFCVDEICKLISMGADKNTLKNYLPVGCFS